MPNDALYDEIHKSVPNFESANEAIRYHAKRTNRNYESLKSSYLRWKSRKGHSIPPIVKKEDVKQIHQLTEDEAEFLANYRESRNVLTEECRNAGIDTKDVTHWWYKSKLVSAFVKPNKESKSLEDLKEELMRDMNKYSPKFTRLVRQKIKDPHCLVIDPADIHIGKLASSYETGEDYNNIVAVKRVKDCFEKILDFSQNFPLEKIVLIVGNDILHVDTPKRTTTSGTPQDTDGQWYDNFMIAQKLYVYLIEKLVAIADVHVIHNVSNHDYMTGWFLSQATQAWFRNSKNITFDCDMKHRKAYVYGENLIGTTHGDGAKNYDLPLILAQEFKKEWAITTHRYVYTGHVHHKQSKDYVGVTVESSRSVSGTDGWHHRNGYQHSKQAMEAYLHHKTDGQIARFTAISK